MTGFRLRSLLLLVIASPLARAAAQQPTGAPSAARVEALVHDSIAGRPLGAATVQLVSASDPMAFTRTAATDAEGRVVFRDVPAGRYNVGFMHPLLDTLGVTAPVRSLTVDGDGAQRIELAVPGPNRVRLAVCGERVNADSSGVYLGTVRDPRDGVAVADAKVTAQWMEVTFGGAGIQQRVPRITATTGANGWFALCGLPPGTVTISVARGADSIPPMDFQVQPLELRRGDLYVPASGHGRLRGRVTVADSARPVAGARVAIAGGPETTTDARGEWSLADAPLGTRVVEVRAVGYYPERRPVAVLADAGAPVEVTLQTFQAVLEAVRVTAMRYSPADAGGFAERKRSSGMGRYYDATQITRRNAIYTSDLLKTTPGFIGDGSLTMKGNFSDGFGNFDVGCTAEVYVDGHLMRGISASELDGLVDPVDIAGMEVYAAGSPKPAQFESGMSGCGALVIWLKPMSERIRRRR